MTIIIRSSAHDGRLYPDTFVFPGGEVSVNVNNIPKDIARIYVEARLRNSEDIMELLLVTDALRRRLNPDSYTQFNLNIYYMPYARQDRVCNNGEALSIKVMADLINSLNYYRVYIADPHSDVTPALINNCTIIEQPDIISRSQSLRTLVSQANTVLVSPDAGAAKKTLKIAQAFGISEIMQAEKVRDTRTGEITATSIPRISLEGKNALIVDDICDGGRTFIELAKALKNCEFPPDKIFLYITHGIFSKGLDVFDGLIDHIWTTNSFFTGDVPPNLTVIPMNKQPITGE